MTDFHFSMATLGISVEKKGYHSHLETSTEELKICRLTDSKCHHFSLCYQGSKMCFFHDLIIIRIS